MFFGGMDAVAGPMMRQMKQLGINAKFMGGDGICSGELPKLAAGAMADGQVVCAEAGGVEGEQEVGWTSSKAAFKKKFNADVQIYAPYVYDAVMVMVAAMVKAGSADPAGYLPVLAKTEGYKGVTGTIAFDEGRHQERRADPVHLQGRQARADRRGALIHAVLERTTGRFGAPFFQGRLPLPGSACRRGRRGGAGGQALRVPAVCTWLHWKRQPHQPSPLAGQVHAAFAAGASTSCIGCTTVSATDAGAGCADQSSGCRGRRAAR